MKYTVRKLDRRYSYKEFFKYCLVFNNSMAFDKGILHFNDTLLWFAQTYGPSTEIRMWKEIFNYHNRFGAILKKDPVPDYLNFNWSWSNGYDDLRIYVKSDKELGFFKLANPVDSNK